MSYSELNDSLIARNYDASYAVSRDPSGDAEFYRELAHEVGGPILELGCGTGRVLLQIARDGIACVGLDGSAPMLDVLRAKSPPANLRLVLDRMESFDLPNERFALITSPFRAFQHMLDVDTQLAMLERVRRHLRPGGVFAFDVFDPKPDALGRDAEPPQLAISFEAYGRRIERWDTVRRDRSTQILTVASEYRGGPPELQGAAGITLRWFHRFELEHLLARVGFSDLTFYRNFKREPWTAGGETIVLARLGR
jgi:SAM-dependent methyltransferase